LANNKNLPNFYKDCLFFEHMVRAGPVRRTRFWKTAAISTPLSIVAKGWHGFCLATHVFAGLFGPTAPALPSLAGG
jgi:hypothetical protein